MRPAFPAGRCRRLRAERGGLWKTRLLSENYFGEEVAARYDEDLGAWGAPESIGSTVDFLAELAGGAAALELGIGTGRIALPLTARGVRVAGIDLSEAMVARLRAKPGGDDITVVIGDFATTRVEGAFALAYVVFNTIMNLRTQEAQVACFENVARHLQSGGCFVAEIMLPELQRLPPGERFLPFEVSPEHLGFDEYDTVQQRLTSHHYYPDEGAYSTFPGRYIWPAELDLMARLAGMRLRERWSDWKRSPFTAESTKHISVWEKP
jgi:SAM-dependent methyltransferase